MEEIRKQTVSRIAEFFNGESTNAEVDTYKKLLDFEKEVEQQFSLQGVSRQSELLQKIESVKNFEWGINPVDNENRMCELIKLL